jgi:hypothetical protein
MTDEISSAIAEAFREHRDAFGVPITIGGKSITAVVNENEFSRELVEGGFAEAGNMSVKALLADFTTVPTIGTAATYKSRAFKVSAVLSAPGASVAEFAITPASR